MSNTLKRTSAALLAAVLMMVLTFIGFTGVAYAGEEPDTGDYSAEGTMTFHTNGGTLDIEEGEVEDPVLPFAILLQSIYDEDTEEYHYEPYGDCETALADLMAYVPVKSGNTFDGWYADESLTVPVGEDYMGIAWSDTEDAYDVYAKWTDWNGWIQIDDDWYYYNNGTMVTSSWVKDSKGWCWIDASGLMLTQTKWLPIGSDWYHITDGYRDQSKWMKDSKGWCYLGTDGKMITNGWAKDSKGWCRIGADGYMVTQTKWLQIGPDWYHITNGYRDQSKWMKDSKGWCYLGTDGKMITNGWAKDSKGWCWIGSDGYMLTKTQWIKDGGNWYYINNGYMVSNQWKKDSKGWCYLSSSGKMVTNGWAKDSKGWCWLGSDGYMVTWTKWIEDKGKIYYLYKGYCASDDRGMPKKPDDTVPTTISGVTKEHTYTFDSSLTGTDGNGNSCNLKTVLAMSEPTMVILQGTISFSERYKVGSNTEIDATGATLYCASSNNDGCLTNAVPSCNYNAVTNIIVRGGTWKKESGYHAKTMFFFVHGNNIRVENAKIECAYNGGHCIELVACSNVVVKECDLQMFSGTPGEDEPMQLDHASTKSAPTITNLNANAANGHACKNIQIMNSTMKGGRGLCAGHAANDSACANIYHENVFVENNTITGVANEGCALFNVYNAVISGNTIKATGGSVTDVNSCALHVQIPQNSKAPSDYTKTSVLIMNNKCYGGRNGILVYSHSDYKSKFGKVYIFSNNIWYKGTDTAAINWGGWDHKNSVSFDGVPNLTLAGNTLKKGW